jgi:hypothetical protein
MRKLFQSWLFSNQPETIYEIQGACKQCGSCCKNINLCEAGKWVSKKSHFQKMVAENAEYARLTITGKNKKGTLIFSCTWLDANNHCKDYDNRLDICQMFPNKMVITNQGEIPEGCGYSIRIHRSFDVVLKNTIRREKIVNRWQRLKNGFKKKISRSPFRKKERLS